MDELGDLSIDPWRDIVERARNHPSDYFEVGVFSEIHLPIRLNGQWLLLICSPYEKQN
jgi:hypothetical protein